MKYTFNLANVTDSESPVIESSGSGPERVVAALMRAAADEIDPPDTEFSEKIAQQMFGGFMKNSGPGPQGYGSGSDYPG